MNSSGPDDDDDAAARERWTQAHLAAPVFVNMCVKTLCDIVTIGFVGRLEDPSSAMGGWALAQTLLNVSGKSIMVGLASAVSTIAWVHPSSAYSFLPRSPANSPAASSRVSPSNR